MRASVNASGIHESSASLPALSFDPEWAMDKFNIGSMSWFERVS